jgi:hypothetical protein
MVYCAYYLHYFICKGVDIMIERKIVKNHESDEYFLALNPSLLEVNYQPDCNRAVKVYFHLLILLIYYLLVFKKPLIF